MPRETFFKLPAAKRQRIVETAIEEFAAHTYYRASLSRIVERAAIAKGSMYQYFTDKFDLYIYILGLAGEAKLTAVRAALAELGPRPDFFAMLRASLQGAAELARRHPRLAAVAANLMLETDSDLRRRVMDQLRAQGPDTLEDWLQAAVAAGQVDPAVIPAAAGYVLTAVSERLASELARGTLELGEVVALMGAAIDILELGMRPRTGRHQSDQDPPRP